MKKRTILLTAGLIGVILIFSTSYYKYYHAEKSFNGNSNDGIIKSIIYLHQEYMDKLGEITIIDEFNYDYEKIVLFSADEVTGFAKFIKDSRGKYKINFVETFDKNNDRKVFKVS